MEESRTYVNKILQEPVQRIIFSNPSKSNDTYKRIEIRGNKNGYQAEKRTEKQAFHENFSEDELEEKCIFFLEREGFQQMNVFGSLSEQSLRISKKGKILYHRHPCIQPMQKVNTSHDRKKKYRLMEGTVVLPLIDMGVFTPDGKIVPTMYGKFRQINKFLQFIEEAVEKSGMKKLNIIDFGCGKSYLTFVVYYFLVYVKHMQVEMVGLDLKEDVIKKCNVAAKKYGYEHLKFEVGNIAGYRPKMEIDMVISLHACDTATDFALYNAIQWKAKMIISVPCCQQELCGQMNSEAIPIMQRYGIIKERTSALMTDAIRANLLEYCGYKTQVLEFVDMENTPKNLLLRAVKTNIQKTHRKKMQQEVETLCQCFSFSPMLRKLLKEAGIYEI